MNKKGAWVIAWLILFGSRPAAAFQLDEIDIHGFISQGYLKSDLNDSMSLARISLLTSPNACARRCNCCPAIWEHREIMWSTWIGRMGNIAGKIG